LFTDDTSVIFSNSESTDYATEFVVPFDKINLRFAIHYHWILIKLYSKMKYRNWYKHKFWRFHVNNIYNIKYLGLPIDNTLSWKKQIEQLTPRLSSVGYSVRSFKSVMSQKSLRTIYFSYVHPTMSYGIIFWGNFSYSSSIFKKQTRTIIIIMNAVSRDLLSTV